MALGQIRSMPRRDDPARAGYDFAHYLDHLAIVQKIASNKNLSFPLYPIWPVPSDFQIFLQNHNELHKTMTLASPKSIRQHDLLRLDDSNDGERDRWSFRNYLEHVNIRGLIGLSV